MRFPLSSWLAVSVHGGRLLLVIGFLCATGSTSAWSPTYDGFETAQHARQYNAIKLGQDRTSTPPLRQHIAVPLTAAQATTSAENATSKPASASSSKPTRSFNQAMTDAHAHIDAQEWQQAHLALTDALKHRPNSAAAKELSEVVQAKLGSLVQREVIVAFEALMAQEKWLEATQLAKLFSTDQRALNSEVQRATSLTQIEQDIEHLLANPADLPRRSTQTLMDRIRQVNSSVDVGSRIGDKLDRLMVEYRRWTTPIAVKLVSDGKTRVILRPGKNFGSFRSQRVELLPGEYQLIGRRDGFREVRRTLSLKPGEAMGDIDIRARERF